MSAEPKVRTSTSSRSHGRRTRRSPRGQDEHVRRLPARLRPHLHRDGRQADDQNADIFKRILDDAEFQKTVLDHYAERLYERRRAEHDQLGMSG
jgi:hypothetical protein